jgi:thioester reductase-like protein
VNILLTGVTGLIGAELAMRLSGHGHSIVATRRRRSAIVLSDGKELRATEFFDGFRRSCVQLVSADVAEPQLGMPLQTYELLARQTDLIIHSAAVTEFGHPDDLYQRTNVGGTEQILQFATFKATIPVVYVSTAYVCGFTRGEIPEDHPLEPVKFANAYEASKFRAEALVRSEGRRGLPYVIVRPSIVVGASNDGRIREFKNIYTALRLITKGKVTSIPGRPAATLDLVPWDYVCEVVEQVVSSADNVFGKTFHVVGRQPVRLQDFSDVIAEYPSLSVPRFVPAESFVVDALSPSERRLYRQFIKVYEPYFVRHMEFTNQNTLSLMNGRVAPKGRPFLRKLIDYGERVGFFGRELTPVE